MVIRRINTCTKLLQKLILKKSLWRNFLRWESKQDAVQTKVEIDERRKSKLTKDESRNWHKVKPKFNRNWERNFDYKRKFGQKQQLYHPAGFKTISNFIGRIPRVFLTKKQKIFGFYSKSFFTLPCDTIFAM